MPRANPGVLNFASTGSGTANHLAVEMLSKQADVKVATIFYKGSMEGITDVIGGRTHAMFAPASSVIPQVQAGKLKAIAVTGGSRTSLAPDVPTMSEAGLSGYEVTMWNGLFAPAGTPPEVVRPAGGGGHQGGCLAGPAVEDQEQRRRPDRHGAEGVRGLSAEGHPPMVRGDPAAGIKPQ